VTVERPLPALQAVWRIRHLAWVAGGAAALFPALTVLGHELLDLRWGAAAGRAALVALAGAVIAGAGVEWHVRAAFARLSWTRFPGEGVVAHQGAWWHKEIWLPVSRLQHLDVVRGPLERAYGIATLALFTAGYHQYCVKLEGMDPERALALRDALLGETRAQRPSSADPVTPA
jgi:membrane protein YdbS with pleckstrin-like domain